VTGTVVVVVGRRVLVVSEGSSPLFVDEVVGLLLPFVVAVSSRTDAVLEPGPVSTLVWEFVLVDPHPLARTASTTTAVHPPHRIKPCGKHEESFVNNTVRS
jgi:hypothetical protein